MAILSAKAIVASAAIVPSIKDLCASIRDIMGKIQVEIDKLQQIEKMEIAREQLSKKSACQVSAVVRMQAATRGLRVRRWVLEMRSLQLIQPRIP
jgi:hypothetical protein